MMLMRKLIMSLILLFASSSGSILAQSVAVPKTIVYESETGGFKVSFPSKPTVHTESTDTSYGKTAVTTVTLPTAFATYSVTFIDFPTVMNDRFDLNIRYDAMRDSQAKRMSARVVKDAEYLFGSHYGREVTYETAGDTTSSRVFAAGPRFFVLMVVTRGKMSSQPDGVRNVNQARVDKFFNSFEITKVPDAKQFATELPADFGISISEGRFESKFLGLSLVAPAGWTALNKDDAALIMELGKDSLKSKSDGFAERLNDQNSRSLAMFSNSASDQGIPDAFLVILAEKAPYPNFMPSAVSKTFLQLFRESGEKITQQPTAARIGGIDFSWVETFRPASRLYHRIYFANIKGISFEVSMSYRDQAALRLMVKSLETVSFVSSGNRK